MPALLTSTSNRPNALVVSANKRFTSAGFETSARTAIALPSLDVMSSTTLSPPDRLLAKFTTTDAPSAANWRAISAPNPLDAPVTTATFPDNLDDMASPFHCALPPPHGPHTLLEF